MPARKLYETNSIQVDAFIVSTVSTHFSTPVKIDNADKICFDIGCRCNGISTVLHRFGLSVMQSSNATQLLANGGATVAGTTLTIGCANATLIQYAKRLELTMSTATTSGQFIILNGTTLTVSTAFTTNADCQFGSTIGSTIEAGLQQQALALTSVIKANFPKLDACTLATASMAIWVKDTASTYITLQTTGAINAVGACPFADCTAYFEKIIELYPRHFASTARYACIRLSSGLTTGTFPAAVVTIKSDMFTAPAPQHAFILPTTS